MRGIHNSLDGIPQFYSGKCHRSGDLAAQSAPKLIDLYMENVPTMSYVWWTMACAAHCYTLKLLPELGYDVSPSLVFNYHVLFPVFLFTNFPFVLAVLLSTRPIM